MAKLLYFDALFPILERAAQTQTPVLLRVAERLADAVAADHLLYVFGAGHAGIIAEEMFYRAGGLMPVAPIFGPGLTPQVEPITLGTDLERMPGYGRLLLDASHIAAGDVLIVHSNSGRNTVAIEVAEEARRRGVTVVALTSVAHSSAVPSRHPQGHKLMDVADYVIDNCGVVGDAAVEMEGFPQRVAATSTVVGAALMQALVTETVRILLERGVEPPVLISANVDGSAEHNERLFARYRSRLRYL